MLKMSFSGFVSAISLVCIDRLSQNFVAGVSWGKDELVQEEHLT